MLGFHEPLDCRSNYTGVLDLSTSKDVESGWSPHSRTSSDSPPVSIAAVSPTHAFTPRVLATRDVDSAWGPPSRPASNSPPAPIAKVSPTLAVTQRVLAAASSTQGTRPFKAYPRDPLSLSSTHSVAYLEFRRQMLSQTKQVASKNSPSTLSTAKKRPSSPQHPTSSGADSDDKDKDAAYWERRRKNNEAAKRSRDARRAKEDEIAIRAAFLEQENLRLKYQIAALTDETAKLRCMLYQTENPPLPTRQLIYE